MGITNRDIDEKVEQINRMLGRSDVGIYSDMPGTWRRYGLITHDGVMLTRLLMRKGEFYRFLESTINVLTLR